MSHIEDQANLTRFLRTVRRMVPNVKSVDLESSDQDRYGFVLTGVTLEDDTKLADLDMFEDVAWDYLCNLSWNGVVGENKGGYATLDVPPAGEIDYSIDPGCSPEDELGRLMGIDFGHANLPEDVPEGEMRNAWVAQRVAGPLLAYAQAANAATHEPLITSFQDIFTDLMHLHHLMQTESEEYRPLEDILASARDRFEEEDER